MNLLESFYDVETTVDQRIIMKYSEELSFGQLYILQSKMKNIFEGECIPTTWETISTNVDEVIIDFESGRYINDFIR